MPTTRSATRNVATIDNTPMHSPATTSSGSPRKRKIDTSPEKDAIKKHRKTKASNESEAVNRPSVLATVYTEMQEEDPLVAAKLMFSLEEAKQHLVGVDHRFEDLFSKLPCKPFEHLEQLHPFRALTTSILGQQISWQVARSITHKFRRLFNPSLPEKADDDEDKSSTSFFPTPAQVANTDIAVLRTAGLSGRKAEYVQDLAARFADGRLSTKKLINANDEQLAEMLIEVRGIGRWTGENFFSPLRCAYSKIVLSVDMFAIFSLRRPDILPTGDLGVQRGMARWFLSQHSTAHTYSVSPEKPITPKKKNAKGKKDSAALHIAGASSSDNDSTNPDVSSTLPATTLEGGDPEGLTGLPPAFTPSIKKTLKKPAFDDGLKPPALPEGLSVAELKARLYGKKKIKGAFLTPQEMIALAESWKPYRSIGVYFMWSLADAE